MFASIDNVESLSWNIRGFLVFGGSRNWQFYCFQIFFFRKVDFTLNAEHWMVKKGQTHYILKGTENGMDY
jgi:hypothetical protein